MSARAERKKLLLEAIADRLSASQPREWASLMAQFPEVPRRTFYRYVAQVRQELTTSVGDAESWIHSDRTHRLEAMVRECQGLMADAEALRASAFRADGSIRDPNRLVRSIDAKARLLPQLLPLLRESRAADKEELFMHALVAELAAEGPEFVIRMMRRLRRLRDGRT